MIKLCVVSTEALHAGANVNQFNKHAKFFHTTFYREASLFQGD